MKTIEEAAKEYAENKSSAEVFRDAHIRDFKAGVEFAQRWISVDEELPELKNKIYSILGKDNNNVIDIFYIEDNRDIDDCIRYFTHWRPIELI